jgi:hypothetical protein
LNIIAKIYCEGYTDIYQLHRNKDNSFVWRFYTYTGIGSPSELDAINLKLGADRKIKGEGYSLKFEPEDLLLKEV